MHIESAVPDDAAALAALHAATSADLTTRFGAGNWSRSESEKSILRSIAASRVVVARDGGTVVGTLTLATKKPWAIDREYFAPARRPLYLISMAVAPPRSGQGIGRVLVAEGVRIASAWPADAIWLDAYDAPAGAGGFYAKCGFHEVGRTIYRNTPLVYFERRIG